MDASSRRSLRWWPGFWVVPVIGWLGVFAVIGMWVFGGASASPASTASARLPRLTLHAGLALTQPAAIPTERIPVSWILTPVGGAGLTIYAAPDGPAAQTLAPTDELGSPLVLLAVAREGGWFQALLPTRPNGSTGWVRATDVTESAPAYRVEVSTAAHQLQLIRTADHAVVLSTVVGIGAPSTPTPTGQFFVRDLFPTHSSDHPYGPFAFGLSGHSDVLMHFGTGDGRIAIHGTNEPATIGANLSNGCVHVPNDVDLALIPDLSLGTPVTIS
jgi:lipoprotein-anchoring transpeptidase ErfK/SrfK